MKKQNINSKTTAKTEVDPPILKRHLDLVGRYYEIDREKKIIHLKLHYAKVEEILETDIGDIDHPSFRSDMLERIVNIINSFPTNYQVDVELQIEDYQGYDPKKVLQAFNDEFEFNHFANNKDNRGNRIKALALVVVAVIIIFLKAFLSNGGYLGEGTTATAYDTILDTLATLFIWEAGTVLFLNNSDTRALVAKILKQMNRFAMLDGKGKTLAEENRASMTFHWVEFGRLYAVGSNLLCFFSGLMLVMGLSRTIDSFSQLDFSAEGALMSSLGIVFYVIYLIILVLVVVSGYSYYADRGKLKKACGFFAISFSIIVLLDVGFSVFSWITEGGFGFKSLLSAVFSVLSDLGFALGYFLLRKSRKQRQMANAK